MMKNISRIAALLLFLVMTTVAAEEFTLSFEWGDIPPCATGWPNSVPNPIFILANVPDGTKYIKFEMTDLDVPSYNHGGGTIAYTGQNIIEPGAFNYASPCPPTGVHQYEWTAKAKKKKSFFSRAIDVAKSVKNYP